MTPEKLVVLWLLPSSSVPEPLPSMTCALAELLARDASDCANPPISNVAVPLRVTADVWLMAWSVARRNTPWLMVVVPVKLLLPVRVRVPLPFFTQLPLVPTSSPPNVVLVLFAPTVRLVVPNSMRPAPAIDPIDCDMLLVSSTAPDCTVTALVGAMVVLALSFKRPLSTMVAPV